MSDRPLVTIGVPTCERSRLLRRALSSLTAQDYPIIEIVVSDNASTDDTAAVCKEIGQRYPHIQYHRTSERIPAFQNFRNALILSHGDYFMWASDDDLWEPTFVSTLVRIMEESTELMLVAAEAQYVLNDGTQLPFFPEGRAFYHRLLRSPLRRIAMMAKHGYGNLFYGLYRREALIDLAGNTALDVCTFPNELPPLVLVADRGGIQVHSEVLFYKTTSLKTYRQAAREFGFVPRVDLASPTPAADPSQQIQCSTANGLVLWRRGAARGLLYHAHTMWDIRRALWRIRRGPGAKLALLLVFAAYVAGHLLKLAIVWPVENVISTRVRS